MRPIGSPSARADACNDRAELAAGRERDLLHPLDVRAGRWRSIIGSSPRTSAETVRSSARRESCAGSMLGCKRGDEMTRDVAGRQARQALEPDERACVTSAGAGAAAAVDGVADENADHTGAVKDGPEAPHLEACVLEQHAQ